MQFLSQQEYGSATTRDPQAQPSAQHVLFCDELLRRIIDHLYHIEERGFLDWECKDTLASLASTSTSISEPALDALWKYLDDTGSLRWLLEVIEQNCTPLRLYKYFNRIQVIRVYTSCWGDPLPSLFTHLPQPVFPHLTRLILAIDSDSLELDLFLVPGLRVLSAIVSMGVNVTPSALVRAFSHRTPHLNDLHLEWLNENVQHPDETLEVLGLITKFRELKRLSINLDLSKEPQFLQALSVLRLEELCLTCPIVNRMDPPWTFSHCRELSSIRTLKLDGPIRMTEAIFQALSGTAINTLDITLQESFRADKQTDLSNSIVSNFSSTIESVTIRFDSTLYLVPSLGHVGTILPQFITPLFSTQLTELHLGSVQPEDISDVLCKKMSESWPRLRRLTITTYRLVCQPPPYMVTLASLKWFAIGCPELSELTMQLNGLGSHWEDHIDASLEPKAFRLMLLNLQGSSVDCPIPVVNYLRWCFPYLRDVRFSRLDIIETRDSMILDACATACHILDNCEH